MRFDLADFRKRVLKLTKVELAARLDVCRNTLQKWEKSAAPKQWVRLACIGLKASTVLPDVGKPMSALDLCAAREALGLNQQQFGQCLGVTRATICRWENGEPPVWLGYAVAAYVFTQGDF